MEPSENRIVVMGAGYVGLVTGLGLAALGHRVELVETRADRREALAAGRAPIHEPGMPEALAQALAEGNLTITAEVADPRPDLILVCVGTPLDDAGKSDLSQLDSAMASVAPLVAAGSIAVIRSTMPVGTSRSFVLDRGLPTPRMFTNPEFLRQGRAIDDFRHPSRVVLGTFEDADPSALAYLAGLFGSFGAPLLVVDVTEAELIKNAANAFLALKLSFTNEIAVLCEMYGADAAVVLDGVGRDERIGRRYMQPSFGFGGSCLPKELRTFAAAGRAKGLAMHVTAAASDANESHQRRFAERIGHGLGGLHGKRIGVLGLAFKADTDDIRYSPAVKLAELLAAGGARVLAYDPQAGANARATAPGFEVADSVLETVTDADTVVIATEWPEFRDLDWAAVRAKMAGDVVYDGRRILDPDAMARAGLRLERLGSPSATVVASVPSAATS